MIFTQLAVRLILNCTRKTILFRISTLKKSEVRFKTSSSFRLDCSEAAYKIRIEHSMVIIIGINTVRIVKEIYNADRPITSSTKNLEQGRTKDKNQTVAMRT